MTDLTYQQISVLDRAKENNRAVALFNADIRRRATFVTGASTAIVGLITAARFLPSREGDQGVELALLGLVCLCSVAMYGLAAAVWRSGEAFLPGRAHIDSLYKSFISADLDTAYHNLLQDECAAMNLNTAANSDRARLFDWIVGVFMVQLSLLALAISWGYFAA